MAVVRPFAKDQWWHIRTARPDPDKQSICFGRSGEFSPYSDVAFEKHCKKLEELEKFYYHLNGQKIKAIRNNERLWY